MDAFLAALGAGTNDMLAAFLGSIVGAFLLPEPTPRTVVSNVVVGSIVGTIFGPNAPPLIGVKPSNMITCMMGMAGTPIAIFAVGWITKRFKGGMEEQ